MSILEIILAIIAIVLPTLVSLVYYAIERGWFSQIYWRMKGEENRTTMSLKQAEGVIERLVTDNRVKVGQFSPDLIVGVEGGGYVVAGILCEKLGKKPFPLGVIREGREAVRDIKQSSLDELGDISNKALLVVDDDSNTGNTLYQAKIRIQERGGTVQFAVLARRTDRQLDSPKGDYLLRSSDYLYWSWKTKQPVKMPWTEIWASKKRR